VGILLIGADPDQLDALGVQMNAAARRLGEIRSELESLLRRFEWDGGGASEFHDEWSGRLAPLIDATGVALGSAAKSLAANAAQQREASGDAGGSGTSGVAGSRGVASIAGVAGVGSLSTLLLSGSAALAKSDALGVTGKYVGIEGTLVGVAALDQVKKVLQSHVVGDVELLGKVSDGLGVASLGIDEVTFIGDFAANPHSSDTYNDEVNMAFDSAALVAGVLCPPAGIAVGIAGFVYSNYVDKSFPNLSKDIVDGVGAAGTAVGKTFAEAAETDLKAVDVAGSVLSSGVHGVLSHIHF
jgi:hypothetical protein